MSIAFVPALVEGIVLSRPNRFIMNVLVGKETFRCHCPCTGAIGPLTFDRVPCLLSKNTSSKAKTAYTVEAIGLHSKQPLSEEVEKGEKKKKGKKEQKEVVELWCGINQTRVNRYIETFLQTGVFDDVIESASAMEIKRERTVGESRLDFEVGEGNYIEVKSPMTHMVVDNHPLRRVLKDHQRNSLITERLKRHYTELGSAGKGKKVVMITFQYNAQTFQPSAPSPEEVKTAATLKALRESLLVAEKNGVETWQVNMEISKDGVRHLSHWRLPLFSHPSWGSVQGEKDADIHVTKAADGAESEKERPEVVKRKAATVSSGQTDKRRKKS